MTRKHRVDTLRRRDNRSSSCYCYCCCCWSVQRARWPTVDKPFFYWQSKRNRMNVWLPFRRLITSQQKKVFGLEQILNLGYCWQRCSSSMITPIPIHHSLKGTHVFSNLNLKGWTWCFFFLLVLLPLIFFPSFSLPFFLFLLYCMSCWMRVRNSFGKKDEKRERESL